MADAAFQFHDDRPVGYKDALTTFSGFVWFKWNNGIEGPWNGPDTSYSHPTLDSTVADDRKTILATVDFCYKGNDGDWHAVHGGLDKNPTAPAALADPPLDPITNALSGTGVNDFNLPYFAGDPYAAPTPPAPAAYASIQDIANRLLASIPEEDSAAVSAMLADASAYVDAKIAAAGASDPGSAVKRLVVIDLVASWYSTAAIPSGASSTSQTVGDVTQSITMASAGTAGLRSPWWLSAEQKSLLGIENRLSSIRMIPDWRVR